MKYTLNDIKIEMPEIIFEKIESILVLANLMDYEIEYQQKFYSSFQKFYIISLFKNEKLLLRLKLKLDPITFELINICFIEIINNEHYHNIFYTNSIDDPEIFLNIENFINKI